MPDINLLLAVTWLVGLIAYPVTELLGFEKVEWLPWVLRSKTGRVLLVLLFPVVAVFAVIAAIIYVIASYIIMAYIVIFQLLRENPIWNWGLLEIVIVTLMFLGSPIVLLILSVVAAAAGPDFSDKV